VVKHLPSMYKALGLIPSTVKMKKFLRRMVRKLVINNSFLQQFADF
jgi:hypothetical protein